MASTGRQWCSSGMGRKSLEGQAELKAWRQCALKHEGANEQNSDPFPEAGRHRSTGSKREERKVTSHLGSPRLPAHRAFGAQPGGSLER